MIVGAFPFARDVEAMHDAGVQAVVTTCEEYAGPLSEYQRFGISQFHMPTIDFTHPAFDDVVQAAIDTGRFTSDSTVGWSWDGNGVCIEEEKQQKGFQEGQQVFFWCRIAASV